MYPNDGKAQRRNEEREEQNRRKLVNDARKRVTKRILYSSRSQTQKTKKKTQKKKKIARGQAQAQRLSQQRHTVHNKK